MNKKFIAAILCMLMLLSIVPFAVFAEEADTTAAETVEEPAAAAEETVEPAAEPAAEETAEPAEESEVEEAEEVGEIEAPKSTSPKTYTAIYGQGSSYIVGKSDFAHFGANGKQVDYTGIQIDGKGITAFAAADGNGYARVDLKPEYMCTLSTGKHTAQLFFTDGQSEIINFTVVRETDPYGNPITGDSQNAVLWAVIAVLSLGGLAASAVLLKKEH